MGESPEGGRLGEHLSLCGIRHRIGRNGDLSVNGVHNEGTKKTKTNEEESSNWFIGLLRTSSLASFLRCELRSLRLLRYRDRQRRDQADSQRRSRTDVHILAARREHDSRSGAAAGQCANSRSLLAADNSTNDCATGCRRANGERILFLGRRRNRDPRSRLHALNFDERIFFLRQTRIQPHVLLGGSIPWMTVKDGSFLDPNVADGSFRGFGINTEAGLTVYPVPRVGLSGGYRYRIM